MAQHKIVKIPDWVTPETDQYLSDVGKAGWELIHVYNQHAYMKSTIGGSFVSGNLETNVDSFGRLRVTDTYTLADYKHLYAIDVAFYDYLVSGASNTFNANRASVTLATSASIGSHAVHQTRMYHNYMPGKSQYILSSFKFGAAEPGVIKRTGYFDDYNGIFLEQDQTGSLNWVIRSATNGTASLQENRIKQADWNVNKLLEGDIVLDINHAQLAWIDFQWLSIGRVRTGFVINGVNVLCNVFDHSNKSDGAYMSTPNLPVRCEIINTTTATGSMEQICATVMSEGGYDENGTTFAHTSNTLRPLTANQTSLIMAIRLKNSYNGLPNRAYVRLEDMSVYSQNEPIKYLVVKLDSGSVSGGTWLPEDPSSVVEWNSGSMSYNVSGAREILNGFVAAAGQGAGNITPSVSQRQGSKNKINYIAQNYDSTNSEMYGIIATNLTANTTNVIASMVWKEVY